MALQNPGQMSGADAWRVIRANWKFITISLVLSLFLGYGLNWYLNQFHARYTATGYVQIQPGRGMVNLSKDDPRSEEVASLSVEQRTQTQLLQSEALITKVLSNPNLAIRKTTWFSQFSHASPDGKNLLDIAAAKEDITKRFGAFGITDSKLISVSMTCSDPRDAATIVTDIVNQHIDEQKKFSTDRLQEKVAYLTMLRTRYENQIRQLKIVTARDAVTLQMDGAGRPGGIGQKEVELSQYTTLRIKAVSELAAAKDALAGTENEVKNGMTPATVEQMVRLSPLYVQRRNELDTLEIMIASVQNQGADGRRMRELTDQRDATAAKLEDIKQEEGTTQTVIYLGKLRSEYSAAQHTLDEINQQIENTKQDLAEKSTRLAEYLTKKDTQMGYEELKRRVDDQLDVLNTAMAQLDMNTVAWMSQPPVPETPSFPKLSLTMIACSALALGLSIGLSFLREVMDTTVRSPRDIARVGHMTLLGMIPHEDDDPQAEGVPLSTVIFGAPTSMLAEQFRQVRTRLQHAASLDTTRSILVTSPSPGDGKSTVACNLAAGLALNGRRILLVDANFRRPELHKLFTAGNDMGFSNCLSDIENFEGAVHQSPVPNLDVMTTGPRPTNPTELMESQLLIDFIERALEEYDHVIFDSGPMLLVSETVALAPRVDGVISVVRARSNSRGLLQRMRDQLRMLKAEHLGVVLNGVRSQGGGYYGRNIKTYYEYQDTPAPVVANSATPDPTTVEPSNGDAEA
jgi:capsular exopolysaccharide synthesis family protein